MQFENLVTADEAKDFIDRCDLNGKFERSLAGDQLSPVRTSTQCWCDEKDGCLAHPTVEKVTVEMLKRKVADERVPFGHGYVVAATALGIEPEAYCGAYPSFCGGDSSSP